MAPGPAPFPIPPDARRVLGLLRAAGHAAFLVGGGVRDALLRRPATDWDVATDAPPERILALFDGARYENRFGTVTVPADGTPVEVTTFRRDHRYADHRRPDTVTFTDSIVEDLARRDFTVNAIAWGGGPVAGSKDDLASQGEFVDPSGGRADLARRVLRAVGDPVARFDEDALRLFRASRLAAQLGFTIEPTTRAAMEAQAALAAHVSGERVGSELRRMLAARPPSTGLRSLEETGILEVVLPELAAERGVPQAKIPGHDLWEHSLATLDAAAALRPDDPRFAVTALLHDVGKPETFADGRFIGHDTAGARVARGILARLAYAVRDIDHVARLIEHHMFSYEPSWSDAAVRRFMRRVGPDLVADLVDLRRADNVGSGQDPEAGALAELEARVHAQLAVGAPLALAQLAVDGDDLQAELGMAPGPELGHLLGRLLDSVIADPARNTRQRLIDDARRWTSEVPVP